MHESEKLNEVEMLNSKAGNSVEGIIHPERLLEENYSKMLVDFTALEQGGRAFLEKANDSIGLKTGDAEEIRRDPEMEKRLFGIENRGKTLLEAAKRAMKKAVAIGMATVAFSGAIAKFAEANDESMNETTKIVSVETLGCAEVGKGMEKESLKELEKAKESPDVLDVESEVFDPEQEAENSRQNLIAHVERQEYLDKMVTEYDGDIEKARQEQLSRIAYLESVNIRFMDAENIDKAGSGYYDWVPLWLYQASKSLTGEKRTIEGFCDVNENEIVLPNNYSDKNLTRHELVHVSTQGNLGIPEKTKALLQESYRSTGNEVQDAYYSDPTERLARKQQLDWEMEKLGIKKYGEKFTSKHYKTLLEYDSRKELSEAADNFLMTTEPEYFEMIFNEVAADKQVDVSGQA